MRKRYPDTTKTLILMAAVAVVVVVGLFWPLAIWIVIGAMWLAILGLAVRDDRKRHRQ